MKGIDFHSNVLSIEAMTPQESLSARESIKTVALRLFAEKGFEGVSVRDISRESHQNISQISYYFGNKEGLYKAIVKEHVQQSIVHIDGLISHLNIENLTHESFEESMKSLIFIFVEMRLNDIHISKIFQREVLEGMPLVKDLHDEIVLPIVAKMEEIMTLARKKKIIKKDINTILFFSLLTESIWGFMAKHDCCLSFLSKTVDPKKDKNKFIDQVYHIFFKGICV